MTDSVITYNRGVAAFERRDYRDAITHFTTLLDEEPANASVLEWRARAYFHTAALRKAEADLRALIELQPTDTCARLLLARALERQNRYEDALAERRVLAALTGHEPDLDLHRVFR